jgi:hypothetical protein
MLRCQATSFFSQKAQKLKDFFKDGSYFYRVRKQNILSSIPFFSHLMYARTFCT